MRPDRHLSAVTGRQRRLAWNNDGSDMLGLAYAGGKWPVPVTSPQQYVDSCMRFLEGTALDSLFFCAQVNEPDWEHPTHNIPGLGPEPFRHVANLARRNGWECFYSIRMNDTHARRYPPKASYWPRFRLEHPEVLLGNIPPDEWRERYLPWIERYTRIEEERQARKLYDPAREVALRQQAEQDHPLADAIRRRGIGAVDVWSWAAYDWSRPAVRDRYLAIVDGAGARYEIDGVELDWMRHTFFFRTGEERRHVPAMTDFVRRVRATLDRHGERRGRRLLLAIRTPDSLELALRLGLDVETWVADGLIDLVMAGSGLMPFSTPLEEWVALGRRHEVPVYGCLDRLYPTFRTGRPKFDNRDPTIALDAPSDYDGARAAAALCWHAGVDGVYLYDWHTHHGPTDPVDFGFLPSLHDPSAVAAGDKLYCVDTDRRINGAIADGCAMGQLPLSFPTAGGPNAARLSLRQVDDPDRLGGAHLLARWSAGADATRASWSINGAPLGAPTPFVARCYGDNYGEGFVDDPGWWRLDVPPVVLRRGDNTLAVRVAPPRAGDPDVPIVLEETRLAVKYSRG